MKRSAFMRGLSLSRPDGGARPSRAFQAQHRVQRIERQCSAAGVDVNPSNVSRAGFVANALSKASSSAKQPLTILYDRRPGGRRQVDDTSVVGGASLRQEGCLAEARAPAAPVSFEEISAEGILQYCDDHVRHLDSGEAMPLVQRLYDIAFFEHHITEECRTKALDWIETLRREITSEHQDFSQFEQDCMSALETASRVGRGSLLWQLVEDRVPDDQAAEYVMRPEHAPYLDAYLHVIGKTRIRELKPILIANLVKQRSSSYVYDPVLILHSLTMEGDAAPLALFNAAELHAFINVPDNYEAARQVLAKAGIDIGCNPLGNNRNPRNLSAIPGIVNNLIIKRSRNDHSDRCLIALPDETAKIFKWILVCLRYNIAYRVLTQFYGSSTGETFLGLLNHRLQRGIEHFDTLESGLSDARSNLSINHRLIQELVEYYCPDDSITEAKRANNINVGAQLICLERPRCIDELQKSLRSWAY